MNHTLTLSAFVFLSFAGALDVSTDTAPLSTPAETAQANPAAPARPGSPAARPAPADLQRWRADRDALQRDARNARAKFLEAYAAALRAGRTDRDARAAALDAVRADTAALRARARVLRDTARDLVRRDPALARELGAFGRGGRPGNRANVGPNARRFPMAPGFERRARPRGFSFDGPNRRFERHPGPRGFSFEGPRHRFEFRRFR